MNNEELYPKSSFLMCVTTIRKTDIENKYEVISTNWRKCSGKQFRDSFFEERANGANHSIQIVNEKPDKFIVNQLYMLPTRDRVWVFVEE